MLSPKELKKLAAACRQAGIKQYKTQEFEFTLADAPPVKAKPKAKGYPAPIKNEYEAADALTEEQIMFWSAADDKIGN